MKNKKKASQQLVIKHDSKNQKKQQLPMKKKSTLPPKGIQIKSQMNSSVDSNNFNFYQNKQPNIFYGKKFRDETQSGNRVGDSNQSSTHCSINNRSSKEKSYQNKKSFKSKSLKANKNSNSCQNQMQEVDIQINLDSSQIMQLINCYATKIQRQWRRYWFRKCLKFIILKERQRKKYQRLNQYYEDNKQVQMLKKPSYRVSYDFQPEITSILLSQEKQKKRHTLPKLVSLKRKAKQLSSLSSNQELETIRQSANDTQNILTDVLFNNQKYASLSSINSNKITSNLDVRVENKQIHDRTSSLGEKLEMQTQKVQAQKIQTQRTQAQRTQAQRTYRLKTSSKSVQKIDVGFNCSLIKSQQNKQIYNTSISELQNQPLNFSKYSSLKKSNIKLEAKVYQCKINQNKKQGSKSFSPKDKIRQNESIRNLIDQFRQQKSSMTSILSAQKLKKYDTKFPQVQTAQKNVLGLTRIFKKCKKVIKKQNSQNISSISKKFQQKQITERTYKKMVKQTNEKLSSQMKSLQINESKFKNSLNQIYVMFKDYVKDNSVLEGEAQRREQGKEQVSLKDLAQQNSIFFDKWDFQSSAKKSISHLQSFQEFAKQLNQRNPQKLKGFCIQNRSKRPTSDLKTIELVLDEIDRLDNSSYEPFQHNHSPQLPNQDQLSILFQFRNRERSDPFQRKTQHALFQTIPQKIAEVQTKSSKLPSSAVLWKLNQRPKNTEISDIRSGNILVEEWGFSNNEHEFPQMRVRTKSQNKSQERIVKLQENSVIQQVKIHVPTEQSENGSEVQLKNSSTNFRKQIRVNSEIQQGVKIISAKNIQIQERLDWVQGDRKAPRQQQRRVEKSGVDQSCQCLRKVITEYFGGCLLRELGPRVRQTSKAIRQADRDRKEKRQLQQIQLRKFPPTIDPSIDAVNSWLLQVSHHLLDHHNSQIKYNLVNVKQIGKQQMLQICKDQQKACNFYQTHSYLTISQKVFKQFEFFYLKNVATSLQIRQPHEQTFEHLLYSFHRCLIDCMNITLLDELSIGKFWVVIPWVNSFRYKKNEAFQHSKQCLQRAINKVSGWGQYSLAQLTQNTQVSQNDWKQYQQEKMNLVVREQILQCSIENDFYLSNLIFKICSLITEHQILLATNQISQTFQK